MQEISLIFYKKLVSLNKKIKYIAKIRYIIYIIIKIQIDIAFAISIISHFAKNLWLDYFSIVD